MSNLEKLIVRLQNIAKINNDLFNYRIDIRPGNKYVAQYTLVVEERSDGHEFIAFAANSLEDLDKRAATINLDPALAFWNYKE